MGKATRYCKTKESKHGENVFDIHRPSIFGNPYTHIKSKKTLALYVLPTREDAVAAYEAYFDTMIETSEEFKQAWDDLFDAYCKFDEIFIGCYCELNESCHGDIIIKKLKQRAVKQMLENLKIKRKNNNG